MQWKLKVKLKPIKKKKLALFPLYCGNCGTAYWLENLKLKDDQEYCDCGKRLSHFKSNAIDELSLG